MKKSFENFIKMLTFRKKENSVLGQRKYGEKAQNKPIDKSILSSRKYSGGEL